MLKQRPWRKSTGLQGVRGFTWRDQGSEEGQILLASGAPGSLTEWPERKLRRLDRQTPMVRGSCAVGDLPCRPHSACKGDKTRAHLHSQTDTPVHADIAPSTKAAPNCISGVISYCCPSKKKKKKAVLQQDRTFCSFSHSLTPLPLGSLPHILHIWASIEFIPQPDLRKWAWGLGKRVRLEK